MNGTVIRLAPPQQARGGQPVDDGALLADLVSFYGLAPADLLAMPECVVMALADHVDRLRAERLLDGVQVEIATVRRRVRGLRIVVVGSMVVSGLGLLLTVGTMTALGLGVLWVPVVPMAIAVLANQVWGIWVLVRCRQTDREMDRIEQEIDQTDWVSRP